MVSTLASEHGYLPVATATLFPAPLLDYDLYLERHAPQRMELYRGREYPLTTDDVTRLQGAGVAQLFIKLGDAEAYREYLCQHVLHDSSVPGPQRLTALREATRVTFENAMNTRNCDALVAVAADFGQSLADLVSERGVVLGDMFNLLEHDFYTFTHVCNVSAAYSVLLARELGLNEPQTLAEIAAGGLLHDIGKRHIPGQILNKPDKPTDEQWQLIRRHPATGYLELVHRDDVTWGQLMMVYQHHERLDGTGYPTGIAGKDIHAWARICAVADVFDALTCQRPYRKAIPVPEVCSYLQQHAGDWFDAAAVACWTAQLGFPR